MTINVLRNWNSKLHLILQIVIRPFFSNPIQGVWLPQPPPMHQRFCFLHWWRFKSTSTENTVKRFCNFFGVTRLREKELAPTTEQLSISEFLNFHTGFTFLEMAKKVYQNKQRTSPVRVKHLTWLPANVSHC